MRAVSAVEGLAHTERRRDQQQYGNLDGSVSIAHRQASRQHSQRRTNQRDESRLLGEGRHADNDADKDREREPRAAMPNRSRILQSRHQNKVSRISPTIDKVTSGAAEWIAGHLLAFAQPYGKVAVLAAIVLLTGVLTELLSNNACAALMGVLALATAKQLGMDPRPLLIAVAVTSSYGFATPIGYQTNLMVLGPGGYRFADYLRIGIPLDLLCWVMTIIVIPLVWKL